MENLELALNGVKKKKCGDKAKKMARKRRTSKRSKKIRVPPIPLVYNWSYLHFEICYRYNTEKRYKDRMDQKPAEMSWTAYFKQLHRAENQAMGLIDDGQTTGPPTDPSTSTANHSNEDSASSSEIRVPPLRINPGYWENRHKYM